MSDRDRDRTAPKPDVPDPHGPPVTTQDEPAVPPVPGPGIGGGGGVVPPGGDDDGEGGG